MSKVTEMFQRAEAGDVQAQISMATRYAQGRGVRKSPEQAVRFWLMAAEQGSREGAVGLMGCYLDGHGVAKDPDEAMRWAEVAIARGHRAAHTVLGKLLFDRPGELEPALRHLELGAQSGDLEALTTLAYKFEHGQGVPVDEAKAIGYMERAAVLEDSWAMGRLAPRYHEGRGVARDALKAFRYYGMSMDVGAWNARAWPLASLLEELPDAEGAAAIREIEHYHFERGHIDWSQPIH
jgi:hypothetical protein